MKKKLNRDVYVAGESQKKKGDAKLVKGFLTLNIGAFEEYLAMEDIDPVEAESIIKDLEKR